MTTPTPLTITFAGKTQTLLEWSKDTGIPDDTIRRRLSRNWPIERALTTPPRYKIDSIDVGGYAVSFKQACEALGVSHQAVYKSAKLRGITPEAEIQRRFSLIHCN